MKKDDRNTRNYAFKLLSLFDPVIRIAAAAAAFTAMFVVPCTVRADTIYVGIGENDLAAGPGDIRAAVAAILPFASSIITDIGAIAPATIMTDLTFGVGKTKPGDVLIFHYAGHGFPVTDPVDPNDPNIPATAPSGAVANADEQIGPGGLGVTDDQLAQILGNIPAGATAYVILDACFSGLAIHSNSGKNGDLATIPVDFTATADQVNCAPGTSLFLPLFVNAFKVVNGNFMADTDKDGKLTESELVKFTQNFMDPTANAPQISDKNTNGNLVVATVPEPASMLLLGSGLVGLAGIIRRRQRKLST